jgi:hypothetical protein
MVRVGIEETMKKELCFAIKSPSKTLQPKAMDHAELKMMDELDLFADLMEAHLISTLNPTPTQPQPNSSTFVVQAVGVMDVDSVE